MAFTDFRSRFTNLGAKRTKRTKLVVSKNLNKSFNCIRLFFKYFFSELFHYGGD